MIHWLAHKLGLKRCPQCDTLVEYALEGLEPKQQDQVRQHLTECPSCMEQVRDFWQVREGLGLCAPECKPPEDFGAKVLARLHEHGHGHAKPQGPAEQRHLGGWPRFWMTLGPVFALLSVMMTGVAAFALLGRGPAAQSDPLKGDLSHVSQDLSQDPRAAHVALAAAAGRNGCSGELLLSPGQNTAYLKAENLSKCPQGRNYALWMRGADGKTHRLARFSVEADGCTRHLLTLAEPWAAGGGQEFTVTQDSGPQAGEAWLKGSLAL